MNKRDTVSYKIDKASDMVVGALPPLDRHPGTYLRDVILPEWLSNLSEVARRLGVDRAGFYNVLRGKSPISRDLAYKIGALTRDEVADFLIAYQHAYDLARERDRREAFKRQIERLP